MASHTGPHRTTGARRRRPIHLYALRGFEAAGRLRSFTLAAGELSLTQSSVSRQVSALERQVGRSLFVRKTRALELTAHGQRLLRAVQQALAGVDRAVDEIRGVGMAPRVAVTTYASFASLWLVPRLAAFQNAHPEIEIRIDAGDRAVNLVIEGVDLAIRWCRPESAPLGAVQLLEEEVTPAVSPQLIERTRVQLNEPADLYRLPLLEMDDSVTNSVASSWPRWFEFADVAPRPAAGGRITFSFIDQGVQAAVRGQGAVIARTPFLDDLLAGGELVAPFSRLRMRTGYRYYLIVNPERADLPHVALFAQWVLDEFRRGPQRRT